MTWGLSTIWAPQQPKSPFDRALLGFLCIFPRVSSELSSSVGICLLLKWPQADPLDSSSYQVTSMQGARGQQGHSRPVQMRLSFRVPKCFGLEPLCLFDKQLCFLLSLLVLNGFSQMLSTPVGQSSWSEAQPRGCKLGLPTPEW